MPRPTVLLKRSLIFIHRWMGVALSLLFALWLCSGIVMMYWRFPDVTREDRLERSPVLRPERIQVAPEVAWAALSRNDRPGQVTLGNFDGRPVYRFGGGAGARGAEGRDGGQTRVFADDGSQVKGIDSALIDRVAAAWAKQPLSSAKKESVEEVDQWTVGGQLRTLRPLYKYSFADGQQLYISGRDAEVMQYTTSASRFRAYLGAIPHWLYFTSLRQRQPVWFQVVVWTSGMGTIAAILGIIVALWMVSPSQKYRNAGAPTSIPYKGWKRWHAIIGLAFGIVTATWAFSGLLSMGPFEFVDRLAGNRAGKPAAVDIASALRGAGDFEIASYSAKGPADAIASLGEGFQARELEFTRFGGEAVYIATDGAGATRIVPVHGATRSEFASDQVMNIVRKAAGGALAELRVLRQYDAYYLDRTGRRPLPVVYARLNGESETRYYIDVKTGEVAGTYNSGNWVNRWLYHGLHSLDFPWLYNHRPLWDIIVIGLMLGGTAVCVTSLVLTWRVVKRKLAPLFSADAMWTPANSEDLSQVGR